MKALQTKLDLWARRVHQNNGLFPEMTEDITAHLKKSILKHHFTGYFPEDVIHFSGYFPEDMIHFTGYFPEDMIHFTGYFPEDMIHFTGYFPEDVIHFTGYFPEDMIHFTGYFPEDMIHFTGYFPEDVIPTPRWIVKPFTIDLSEMTDDDPAEEEELLDPQVLHSSSRRT